MQARTKESKAKTKRPHTRLYVGIKAEEKSSDQAFKAKGTTSQDSSRRHDAHSINSKEF
jgi:hypothetical protein